MRSLDQLAHHFRSGRQAGLARSDIVDLLKQPLRRDHLKPLLIGPGRWFFHAADYTKTDTKSKLDNGDNGCHYTNANAGQSRPVNTRSAMSNNRVTLAQSVEMSVREVASLPIDQIAALLEDVAELKASARIADDHLFAAMSLRFSDKAADARKAKGVDTGTVRLNDGEFVVISDLPKKPSWSQAGLREVQTTLAAMGEPIEDYISVKLDVAEKSYTAWPASLRKLFDPHRTVSAGKASFKIEKRKE